MLIFSVCNQDSIETHPSLFSLPLRCRSRERATNERRWNHALGTRKRGHQGFTVAMKRELNSHRMKQCTDLMASIEKVQLAERIKFLVRRLPPLDGGKSRCPYSHRLSCRLLDPRWLCGSVFLIVSGSTLCVYMVCPVEVFPRAYFIVEVMFSWQHYKLHYKLFSKNYIIIRPWLDLTLNMEILYGSLISAENKNKTKKQNKKLQRINKQKATTKKHTLKLTNVTTTKNSAHHNYAHICRNPKKGLQTNQPINSCCV